MVSFNAISPRPDFISRPLRAVAVEPIDQLRIRRPGREQRLYVVRLDALELEQHLIEWTSEVVFTSDSLERGSTFICHARCQRVATEASAGAAWGFLSQISRDVHI
jgi:hypothetical protein